MNSPDLIRRVLVVDAPAFEGGALLEKVRPFIGDGLITLRGTAHRQHRRLLQPGFHRSRIARYTEVMAGLAIARADSWHDGQRIAADVEMMELAMAVVGRTLFSTIAWALHTMSIRGDLQDRAYAEVNEVLGDRVLAYEDLERLDYVRRLLSETLRLYPGRPSYPSVPEAASASAKGSRGSRPRWSWPRSSDGGRSARWRGRPSGRWPWQPSCRAACT